ncbi:AI-2E family transporter [Halomarina litorea]|uniref:AI-2E family transporter n=1 Tax=Halomarina litorea TaxID=2961595 RepID=UPI0020C3A4B2|nr:AI-2E family transporter [Halomarina sp. BCD28]
MVDFGFGRETSRVRLGWWAFVLVLAATAVYIVHAFVGIAVLGVFGYYATRPIYRRVRGRVGMDGLAAAGTLLLVTLPVVVLVGYTGFELFQQSQQWLGGTAGVPVFGDFFGALQSGGGGNGSGTLQSLLANPRQALASPGRSVETLLRVGRRVAAVLFSALLVLALALTLSYALLKHDDDLAAALVDLFGGRDTAAHAYASAVDADLESVFFGNVLFVAVMAVVAAVAYGVTNLLAPAGLRIPIPFVLAALTGFASLIPAIVGKVVYLPVVAYLGVQALRVDGSHLAFVGGALLAYVVVLDLLPQAVVQPYLTGQQLNVVLLLFAYVLGPMLFGWYGFFLLPIVFVLFVEAVRIVLPDLLHGRPLTPSVSMGAALGADLPSARREMGDDSRTDDSVTGEE